ncbi:MAG: MurT ligase domain-containing protein [Firmicutes bacterium]|nr:MurT ligase domain-containing protein [Bacillota bacterium]
MFNLRKIAAIWIGKMGILISRIAGRQGTNLPGKLANRIYPTMLEDLAGSIQKDILIVTGTNGKTTTTNMVASILQEAGFSCVHNQAGANMIAGITTAFIHQTNIWGSKSFDYALLETDEANVPLLLPLIKPRFLLITNFFRDQLDRYGELDNIIRMLIRAVRGTDVELILNADDPLEVHFPAETGLHCWYYGFADTVYDLLESSESREGRYCVFCGHELVYSSYHYAQLGDFRCPQCDSHNPRPDFTAHELTMLPHIRLQVNDMMIESPYQGFYNAYNLLAAVSLGRLAGIEAPVIQRALARFQPSAGRMETFNIHGKRVFLILVKNPAGLNQSLAMLTQNEEEKNLFIALNDNAADGRDISWIWDADIEILNRVQARIGQAVCSGLRSGDMALRIKYAGLDPGKIIIQPSLRKGIEQTIAGVGQVNYILCTYTALFASRKILVKMQNP